MSANRMATRTVSPAGRKLLFAGLLLSLIGWYLLATLPHLADYPLVEAAQMGIAAPAAKLATTGIYGNDLYTGLYRNETRNYEYMPLYAVTVALAYRLGGISVWTGRMVSVICGLAALLLLVAFGKRLHGPLVGLLSGAFLCLVALAVPNPAMKDMYPGAIPFLDIARVMRYDIMVPVWVLAASLTFYHTLDTGGRWGYVLAGFFAGLATLSQLYGAFILLVFGLYMIWQWGWRVWQHPAGYLLLAGWLAALSPWLIYILQDPAAYAGQQLRHQTRLDLLNPLFYVNNFTVEPWRYVKLLGAFRTPDLWPRPGFWLTITAVGAANIALLQKVRRPDSNAERFTWLSLPVLVLTMALLISFKRYTYIVLLLPFLALQVAYGIQVLWQILSGRGWVWRTAFFIFLCAVVIEGALAVHSNLAAAAEITPYQEVGRAAREIIPANAKIIAAHSYYLTLYPLNIKAIDLAFSLSDPAFGLVDSLAMTQTLHDLKPDYIVVPDSLLYEYRENPAGLPGEKTIQQWRDFDQFIQTNCRPAINGPDDPDYGKMLVFQCGAGS